MAANAPVNINYWRWTLPSGTASPAPQPSMPGDENLPELQDLDQTELLAEDFYRKPGIHVIIMPKVEEGILKAEGSEELCRQLLKKFFLPEFFFRRLGWNANGMFGSTENLSQTDEETSYGTFSRFLSKKVREKDPARPPTPKSVHDEDLVPTLTPNYEGDWHYMAFCTLWRSSALNSETDNGQAKPEESADETNILLCFDLDDDIVLRLRRLLHNTDLRNWKEEPFLMLEFALSIVVDQCEEDLWSFRKPVRVIEQTRGKELPQETDSSDNDKTFENLVERYSRLHELSRHVIHISETMNAASGNLKAIVRDHDLWIQSKTRSSAATKRLSKALLLRENMISNLNFRAKAFVSRMDNEIKCASNFVAVADSNISKGILKQTRNEGKQLYDTVSALTLLFLPSTFISGFFGMNFFTLQTNETTQKLQWETHPKIWMFFVCAIPITILGFFIPVLEFSFLDLIQDMQEFMRVIFGQAEKSDVENPSPRISTASDKPRRSYRSFGFSRRATLGPTP